MSPFEHYSIRWADGRAISLHFDDGTHRFLLPVLSMMGLARYARGGAHHVIFKTREPGDHLTAVPPVPEGLMVLSDHATWRRRDFDGYTIWWYPEGHHAAYSIDLEHESFHAGYVARGMRVDRNWRINWVLAPLVIPVQRGGGLHLHSALLELNGKGILLLGQSNTGKTTTCSRLPAPWRALSDDQSVVVRMADGSYRAHPLPTWSAYCSAGLTRRVDVEHSVTLKAILLLNRASKNALVPLGAAAASAELFRAAWDTRWSGWYAWPALTSDEQREGKISAAAIAAEMVERLPAYRLQLSLTGRFWQLLEELLANSP